ncbi:MAG: hypothetical protein JWQ88_1116 [Rhodoferax sp.]|nr:hypothetical protein [Rhodoferax sp.]
MSADMTRIAAPISTTSAAAAGAVRMASWRRLLCGLLSLAALALAALLWRHQADLPAYRGVVFGGDPAITTRFETLSSAVDEAALQKTFAGLAWHCATEAQPGDSNAERVCRADIGRADGVAAMQLAASLREGRLAGLTMRVPWWAHHAALRQLVARFGAPAAIDPKTGADTAVLWRLPGGWLGLDRRPGFDPLATSRLQWRADPAPVASLAPAVPIVPAVPSVPIGPTRPAATLPP